MIYVFTPAGDIIELPDGATPVDFAYRIHTEVGHQCVGAKVNDQMVPLDHKLSNGAVVRILTSNTKVGPSRDWLMPSNGYVVTASAREKIRHGSGARSATRILLRAAKSSTVSCAV
ncbi:MAG: TGS domain-containing protein [Thermomicrobiales bacterium]